MGPPAARTVLQEAIACGADSAVHLSDPLMAGSDCLLTARALAGVIEHLSEDPTKCADVIFVGRSSIDGSTAAVGPMLAEYLGLPFVGAALDLELVTSERGPQMRALLQTEGASETALVQLPAVIAVAERSCEPAKCPAQDWDDGADISTLDASVLVPSDWGAAASPTWVRGIRRARRSRRPAFRMDLAEEYVPWFSRALEEQLLPRQVPTIRTAGRIEPTSSPGISVRAPHTGPRIVIISSGHDPGAVEALVDEGRRLAAQVDGHVVVIETRLAHDDRTRRREGIEGVVILDDSEPMLASIAIGTWLDNAPAPWAILGTPMSWDREVLSRLAVRLGAGLLSDLTDIELSDQTSSGEPYRLLGLKPSGHGVLVEVAARPYTQIATLRTGHFAREPAGMGAKVPWMVRLPASGAARVVRSARFVEHEYEALERASIVIGVGQGVQPADYPLLERLRLLLGAEYAATRKVTDRGWMPHSRQVGVTARDIAPDLYVALGMSGNRNHMVGVDRARIVVAVNTDPEAAIMSSCDVGIVADWREVVENVVEAITNETERQASLQD
jgi:electron transfer flavoprotein alpha subunit